MKVNLEKVEDDVMAEIDDFADKWQSHTVRLARHGREEAIRRVCVNNTDIDAGTIKMVFDRILEQVLCDNSLSAKQREWLKNLVL